MPKEAIRSALIGEVRKHERGLDAEALRKALEKKGFQAEEIRSALRQSLDAGLVRLGPGLRFRQLEAA